VGVVHPHITVRARRVAVASRNRRPVQIDVASATGGGVGELDGVQSIGEISNGEEGLVEGFIYALGVTVAGEDVSAVDGDGVQVLKADSR
jgi:hypothetical protein